MVSAAMLLGAVLVLAPANPPSDRQVRQPDDCGDPRQISRTYSVRPATVVEVIDGDTLIIDLEDPLPAEARESVPGRGKTEVRLVGLEAPPLSEPVGRRSRERLSERLLAKDVEVLVSPHQEDGAPLNVMVSLRGGHPIDENVAQLEEGLARYRKFGPYDLDSWLECHYREAEKRAREEKRGLWGEL